MRFNKITPLLLFVTLNIPNLSAAEFFPDADSCVALFLESKGICDRSSSEPETARCFAVACQDVVNAGCLGDVTQIKGKEMCFGRYYSHGLLYPFYLQPSIPTGRHDQMPGKPFWPREEYSPLHPLWQEDVWIAGEASSQN